jgi:hypothetical protein
MSFVQSAEDEKVTRTPTGYKETIKADLVAMAVRDPTSEDGQSADFFGLQGEFIGTVSSITHPSSGLRDGA